jgi:hypothetical protein
MSLCSPDLRDQIKAQDELRQICHYACVRKESAWVGSVLILRFFHGYYPSEIAKVLRTTRQSVDERLRLARAEAKSNLDNPASLAFMKDSTVVPFGRAGFARPVNEFLIELREMIFHSRQGRCLSGRQAQALYSAEHSSPMRSETLAHIVSCPHCLDMVNKFLGLPPLAERYPTDTIGRDQSGRGGRGGSGDGGGNRKPASSITLWRRRARDVFEHRPKELHISVNGVLQGSQKINSELNEQTLDVDMTEQIGFVEIFSELGIRLLLLNVDEPPPRGQVEQATRIELSDRRSLQLKLRFDSPWPTLHVAYADPLMKEAIVGAREDQAVTPPALGSEKREKLFQPFGPRWGDWTFWLRPGLVTLILAVVVALTFLVSLRNHRQPPPLTATDLLSRSASQETALIESSGQVLHRTIKLEERKGGEVVSLRKVEVWQSGARGITARRLYDDQGKLIAGDWRGRDGTQTLYSHGVAPRLQLANPQSAIRNAEDAWQLSPSAKEFTALIGEAASTQMQESSNAYTVRYEPAVIGVTQGPRLIKATLTLSKTGLHATELTLVVDDNRQPVEFHFIEISFELRAPSAVAPAVFDPEPMLLAVFMKDEGDRAKDSADTSSISAPPAPSSAAASSALEIEILHKLDQAGALYGEQLSLTRSSQGQLVIQGVVDSSKRKGEIRQAVAPFLTNPAVRFEVETAEELAARQARRQQGNTSISVASVQIDQQRSTPAEGDLRAYLSSKGFTGQQLDQEVRNFADRVLAHSRQARRHALALKQIVERFSADDVRMMDAAAREQWSQLIAQHARAIQQETESLKRELQPIFFPGVEGGEIALSDLGQDCHRLFEIVVANDDLVRRSFTIGESHPAAVKSAQFARSLNSAVALAFAISKK